MGAQLARYDAHRAAAAGADVEADRRFRDAGELLRAVGARFYLAAVLLEHAEAVPAHAEPLVAEAGEIFEALDAEPWLERLGRLQSERMFA